MSYGIGYPSGCYGAIGPPGDRKKLFAFDGAQPERQKPWQAVGQTEQHGPAGQHLASLLPCIDKAEEIFQFVEHGLGPPAQGIGGYNILW